MTRTIIASIKHTLWLSLFISFAMLQTIHAQPNLQWSAPQAIGNHFVFTEGPVWHPQGYWLFSDLKANTIYRYHPSQGLSIFAKPKQSSNGLKVTRQGHVISAQPQPLGRALVRYNAQGQMQPFINQYQGKKFNSPNDLWIAPNGGIYFTDPRYGAMDDMQQGGMFVYYVAPNARQAIRINHSFKRPNGIVGSHDGKTLYVADPDARSIYQFNIMPNGQLNNKRAIVNDSSDGMALDTAGNLYITSGNALKAYNNGRLVKQLALAQAPTNVAFGGPDNKTIMVTARKAVYLIRSNVAGLR